MRELIEEQWPELVHKLPRGRCAFEGEVIPLHRAASPVSTQEAVMPKTIRDQVVNYLTDVHSIEEAVACAHRRALRPGDMMIFPPRRACTRRSPRSTR